MAIAVDQLVTQCTLLQQEFDQNPETLTGNLDYVTNALLGVARLGNESQIEKWNKTWIETVQAYSGNSKEASTLSQLPEEAGKCPFQLIKFFKLNYIN